MKKIENYESVQAMSGEFSKPTAGGYICKIINVEDVPMDSKEKGKGDYLRIEYDIADGEFNGYYKEQFDRWGGIWFASFFRSYKEKAQGMFKHFTNCIEESNPNYDWDWNESGLVGKLVGLVLGEEEYLNSNGKVKTKLSVKEIKTVDDIKKGNFKIPAVKKVAVENIVGGFDGFQVVDGEDDLPF